MSWWRRKLHGFYAVLDRPDRALALDLLSSARVMQVRKKPAAPEELRKIAALGRELTALLNATLIINDDLELANDIRADGLHLGQTDIPLREARRHSDLIIGISTHNLAQLDAAVEEGADYVAYGPVFPTRTKADPDAVVGLDGLAAAVERAGDIPVVAIGGITGDNARAVAATGVAAACAISWVNDSAEVRSRARRIASEWGLVR
jgi:thiamine-phosphate pyrophosphorylase